MASKKQVPTKPKTKPPAPAATEAEKKEPQYGAGLRVKLAARQAQTKAKK